MITQIPKTAPAALFALVLAAASTFSTEAKAVSVEITYGGFTETVNDGDPGDTLSGLDDAVEYEEGVSATTFTDFTRLIAQGSVDKPDDRISLESEALFPASGTAASDLSILVSDIGFVLPTGGGAFQALTDFTGILGAAEAVYTAWFNPSNTLFGKETVLATETSDATFAFSDLTSVASASPFGLTLEVFFSETSLNDANRSLLSTASTNVVVPLPAALWLLIGGVGALAALRRSARRT